MTALPDWMVGGLTAADYEALPEDICRQIEIVDGAVIVSPTPSRPHQRTVHRLANALEASFGPRAAVGMSVDLQLLEVPLVIRRPDIAVYDSVLPDDAVLRPQHCLLVVEVMSPDSLTTDRIDKPAEYAAAGIEHFWRVEGYGKAPILSVFRYRLNPSTKTYSSAGMSTGAPDEVV